MIFLGVDIGGTTVKAAALEDLKVLWTSKSNRYRCPARDDLSSAIGQASAGLGRTPDAVGLCVPGILDAGKTRVIRSANMPGLEGICLAELLPWSVNTPHPIPCVINDAYATAFDIWYTQRPIGRLLVLALGTGVGAAVLDDGDPLSVDGESPGHIGQIDVGGGNEHIVGPDGGRGGLEGYLGAAALRRRYGSDPSSKIRPGDPPFLALVRALRICHAIYRPHHICLAGGLGIRLNPLLPQIRHAVGQQLTTIARPQWTLVAADSDFHAAVGAARIAGNALRPGQSA